MSNELTLEVQTQLATKINGFAKSGTKKARACLEDYAKAGELLIQVKEGLPHGMFKAWIAEHCEFSYPSAIRYMNAVEVLKISRDIFDPESSLNSVLSYKEPIVIEAPVISPTEPPLSFQKVSPPPEPQAAGVVPNKPVQAPTRPPCPGREGGAAGDWMWHDEQWKQLKDFSGKYEEATSAPRVATMSVAEAEKIMGIYPMTKEVLQAVFRYQASVNHPDKGGDANQMALINKAYERLQNDYF